MKDQMDHYLKILLEECTISSAINLAGGLINTEMPGQQAAAPLLRGQIIKWRHPKAREIRSFLKVYGSYMIPTPYNMLTLKQSHIFEIRVAKFLSSRLERNVVQSLSIKYIIPFRSRDSKAVILDRITPLILINDRQIVIDEAYKALKYTRHQLFKSKAHRSKEYHFWVLSSAEYIIGCLEPLEKGEKENAHSEDHQGKSRTIITSEREGELSLG